MNIQYIKESITKTLKQMLELRKYTLISDETDTLDTLIGENKEGNQILVFLSLLDKFNTEALVKYASVLNKAGINHGIAVYLDTVTAKANSDLLVLLSLKDSSKIELFCYKELMSNPLNHYLQPEFTVLSPTEATLFKQKYGTNFPVIKKTDKVVRFLGFNRGDIIKITRKNGTVTYRIVKGLDSGKPLGVIGGLIGCSFIQEQENTTDIVSSEIRDKGYNALLTVNKKSETCLELRNLALTFSNNDTEYIEIIYQIIGDILLGKSIADITEQVKSGKNIWDHSSFDSERMSLIEQNNFIEKPFELVEGVITCNCGSKKVYTYSKQCRSGDEGYTTFAECISCKAKWTYRG